MPARLFYAPGAIGKRAVSCDTSPQSSRASVDNASWNAKATLGLNLESPLLHVDSTRPFQTLLPATFRITPLLRSIALRGLVKQGSIHFCIKIASLCDAFWGPLIGPRTKSQATHLVGLGLRADVVIRRGFGIGGG